MSAQATAKSVVLSATVRTMGKVADYDRPFKVVVDQEGTTAIEGKHYEVNLDTVVVPAGAKHGVCPGTFFPDE